MPKGVTYNQTQAGQAEAIADALKNSGGIPVTGGGGDASATNQQTQIQNFGNTSDAAATSDTGSFSFLSLLKRLLSVTLAKGQALMASSISVVIASNQTSVPVTLPSAQLVPVFTNTSASGTIAAGKSAVSFYNSGSTLGTLLGANLPAGASVNFTAPAGQTLSSIAYDASGTTFLIGSL
ncbi:MAG: hypothetical protein KME52_11770 [Desmonostoc geniculatum HA4340-LM1]|jgi:hypothetical protein|nr:hypothetical protein [Desmonostoc geniculatum HA4340-LM1]